MSDEVVEAAPAKVNLSLRVVGRRADGYHLLDSVVAFGPAADVVVARPGEGLSLTLAGPFAPVLAADGDNLVLRAARALADWAGRAPDASLTLHKHLPVASGIGGGSADAAATLRALCRLWRLAPSEAALAAIGLRLGADVPVCLRSQPVRMEGIGECLSPLPPLPACGVLLANPGIPVATAAVFRARTGAFSPPMPGMPACPDAAALAAFLADEVNDLEAPAIGVAPAIGAVLARLRDLPGCLLARMSGSGATCFALFADPAQAGQGRALLPPDWWRSAGPLYAAPGDALLTGGGWGVAKR